MKVERANSVCSDDAPSSPDSLMSTGESSPLASPQPSPAPLTDPYDDQRLYSPAYTAHSPAYSISSTSSSSSSSSGGGGGVGGGGGGGASPAYSSCSSSSSSSSSSSCPESPGYQRPPSSPPPHHHPPPPPLRLPVPARGGLRVLVGGGVRVPGGVRAGGARGQPPGAEAHPDEVLAAGADQRIHLRRADGPDAVLPRREPGGDQGAGGPRGVAPPHQQGRLLPAAPRLLEGQVRRHAVSAEVGGGVGVGVGVGLLGAHRQEVVVRCRLGVSSEKEVIMTRPSAVGCDIRSI
ncbi:collagen, type I, alpha 1b-like [Macrobrachium rosenbergii]|uniref:collagen, type I, alpha 1b-like n=1 Tax=Macrobrachium rosenbergii TaxID=79674 RepID=UPI0034D7AB90